MQMARGRQQGAQSKQRTDTFTGTVYMDPVLPAKDGASVNHVFFAPGARTHWHSHSGGQFILVTGGLGLVCSQGEPPLVVRNGDSVWVPADEVHWHGGHSQSWLTHVALSLGEADWRQPVTEEEYSRHPADPQN